MSGNLHHLMTVAAELRAAGYAWKVVAERVQRKASTVQQWPSRFRCEWNDVYRDAKRRRFDETCAETLNVHRELLHSTEEKTQLRAVEIWLKSGAKAFGQWRNAIAPAPKPAEVPVPAQPTLKTDVRTINLEEHRRATGDAKPIKVHRPLAALVGFVFFLAGLSIPKLTSRSDQHHHAVATNIRGLPTTQLDWRPGKMDGGPRETPMIREEQIDLRRQRARAAHLTIENLGKNRVFSDYRVTNPETKGQYNVTVKGFEPGDNACTCPDFKANTLGTCKHIEAVLDRIQADGEPVKRRKAPVTRSEVGLDYSAAQLRLRIQLPPRHSDQLAELARRFFDPAGFWTGQHPPADLIAAIESVPEQVTVMSDAMDFIDRDMERLELARWERSLLADLDALGDASKLRHLLKLPLFDYQARGAAFLAGRMRAILGDDMGLGKSAQTMAAIELLARERGVRKVLVVAPASVKYQWEGEIRKFTDRTVQVVEGLKEARTELYAGDAFYKLVNYEQVVRDLDELNDWAPDVVVLDEAQRIKNWESKTSRAVKKLRSRYAMVLTGTPLENKLEELYSIVQFVDDRRLGPAFEFLHEHRVLDESGNLVGYRNLDRIREKLAPVLLRRTRAEVLGQLPERTDTTVYVELAPEQQRPYDDQQITLARLLAKPMLTELDRKRVLACLVNMRMLCDSTFLFDKQTNVSPKLDEFAELIDDLMSSGDHKAVVFSQWEVMIRKAAEVLDRLGVGYTLLHGGMSGQERRAVLDRFQQDDCRVFLSTDAGGVGLNLQAADTVVNLELPWNPAVLEQRIARVHRMGQSRPVRVVHFVARGTIEERVQKALESKRALFGSVFDAEADTVDFTAVETPSFLAGARDVVGLTEPTTDVAPVSESPGLLEANVRMLEALAAWEGTAGWTPALRARAATALRTLLERVEG